MPNASETIYRHTRIVRIAHWINALCFLMLLMSGLQIFNAHPRLYWGQFGADHDTPWLAISGGVPWQLTLPGMRDLGAGRNWHFFFAWALVLNGLTYLAFNIFNRHFQRDILPKKEELKPAHLWEQVVHHAQLKRITGAAAKNYNTLQKLAYVAVIFVLFPLIILTGLTMSPGFNAIAPILLDVFGGRQSARSLHFIAANFLAAFLVIHLVEVVVAGAWNEIRSMITGKFVVPQDPAVAEDTPVKDFLSRRKLLTSGAIAIGGLALSGCDPLSRSPEFRSFLRNGETLTMAGQRILMLGQPLAREFSERDISPVFKANGSRDPNTAAYKALVDSGFRNWSLRIDGLVDQPQSYSLTDLHALPSRTQITRHDCVEGWSAIGKWKGVQLSPLLQTASLKPNARFAVMHCADNYGGGRHMYYESIDLVDGFHPQTILAYELNGQPLEVSHGAPLRLRVERQLGYKQAKYLMRIEIVERLDGFGRGKGGYWEDRGYEWYAGI